MHPMIEMSLAVISVLAPIVGCLLVEYWPAALMLSIAFLSYACIVTLGLLFVCFN